MHISFVVIYVWQVKPFAEISLEVKPGAMVDLKP